MSKNRRGGLGRGLGALIPTSAPAGTASPTDIFFGPGPAGNGGAPRSSTTEDAGSIDPTPITSQGKDADGAADERRVSESTAESEPDRSRPSASADGVPDPAAEDIEPSPDLVSVPGAHLLEVAVGAIRPNARQPRTVFDDEALLELTHSVREFGVLQPIVVREVDGGYELVMGERRLRAATAAGLLTVPAIVRDTSDGAMLRDALLENIHRAQLNPLEEAAAYQQLLEEFDVTPEQLATRIGRSRSHLSNTVRLMQLSVPVQRRVAAGVLSAGHARALLGLKDASAQDELAARIVAEGLSVRATEELVTLAVKGHLGATPARRRPARRFTAPAAADLAEKLSDVFDTRVRVDIGQRKGKITVEFASIDDLERIVAVMAPQLRPSAAVDAER